jgi:hypothetical protein
MLQFDGRTKAQGQNNSRSSRLETDIDALLLSFIAIKEVQQTQRLRRQS